MKSDYGRSDNLAASVNSESKISLPIFTAGLARSMALVVILLQLSIRNLRYHFPYSYSPGSSLGP